MANESNARLQNLSKLYGSELVNEICLIFLESTDEQIHTLEKSLKNRDLSGVQFAGHKMKSSGVNLGLERFAELCEYFENINEETPAPESVHNLRELRNEYEKAKRILRGYLEAAS